jgi:hypothetical protein
MPMAKRQPGCLTSCACWHGSRANYRFSYFVAASRSAQFVSENPAESMTRKRAVTIPALVEIIAHGHVFVNSVNDTANQKNPIFPTFMQGNRVLVAAGP